MSLTDEEFREEYHPLLVPAHFDAADTQQNQLIYALAELGEATASQVAAKVEELQGHGLDEQQRVFIPATLKALFDKGLLNGLEQGGSLIYNLHKITRANDGSTDPDLLAPGLD